MGHWGTCPPRLSTISFLVHSGVSLITNYPSVICEISWCRCQQLTALSISTALDTKLLVIDQLLNPSMKSAVSADDIISIFAPPRNKSWRRHWGYGLPRKISYVFSVKECISVHFLQRNIELLVSDRYTSQCQGQ